MRRGRQLVIALTALALCASVQGAPLSAIAVQHLGQAATALEKGDASGAEFHLQAAQKAGAARRDVAVAMGQALLIRGDPADARQWLVSGEFAPGQELAGWRALAQAEQVLGNLNAAGQAFDRALKIAPNNSLLWVEIGRLRYAGGEQRQALGAAEQALALDPDNAVALAFRAQLERDRSGAEAALPLYQRALAITPGDAALRYEYAATLGEMGRATDMLAELRKGAPDDPRALYLQTLLAARAGDFSLARALAGKAGARWPNAAAPMLLRGVLELESGNANSAANLFDELLARQPVNQQVRLLLARSLYESGQGNVLLQRFASVAARDDAPVYLLTLMGRAEEDRGNRTAAAGWLDRAAARGTALVSPLPFPGGAASWSGRWAAAAGSTAVAVPLVRAMLSSNDRAKAERVAEAARAAHIGSADAQWLAGDVQLSLGRTDAALDRYVAASQIRYTDLLVLRMAQALEQQGRPGEAGAATARYLAAFPDSRRAARLAANQRAVAGDWAGSRVLLENLLQRGGGRDARLLADLSLAQLRSGDGGAALETARRAWHLQRGSAVTAQAYGMALIALKQEPAQARQLLDQARLLGGDNPLLVQARKQLPG